MIAGTVYGGEDFNLIFSLKVFKNGGYSRGNSRMALWIIGVIAFILILLLSIGLHEAGHMAVAKKLGLNVPRYFIGFGPTLWSTKKKDTEYGLKAIPMGGFVEIYDPEIDDEKDPARGLLTNVHPAKRIAVFAAGPFVNIFLGVLIMIIALLIMPYAVPTNTLVNVDECVNEEVCGAHEAGLLVGDEVLTINGKEYKDIASGLKNIRDGEYVDLLILRNGKEFHVPVEINDNKMGVNVGLEQGRRTVSEAFSDLGDLTKSSVMSLVELPEKLPGVAKAVIGEEKRAEDSPGSIVAAADVYGQVAASKQFTSYEKFSQLLFYAGAINLSIGFINLFLPMLPLDGGRIFIAVIDWMKMGWAKLFRKKYNPVAYKWVEAMTATTGAMVFAMMGLLILADFVAPVRI